MKIYHNTFTHFTVWERVRLLFVGRVVVHSEIEFNLHTALVEGSWAEAKIMENKCKPVGELGELGESQTTDTTDLEIRTSKPYMDFKAILKERELARKI
jgi:hypothetical protein